MRVYYWLTLLAICTFDLSAEVFVEQHSVVYKGEINPQNNALLQDIMQDDEGLITAIRITSGGGNVDAGMDLAEIVLLHELDVVVPVFCFSSCANYVFVAGKNKTLAEGALIGWHGNAASARWLDEDIDAMVKGLTGAEREKQWLEFRHYYDDVIDKATQREQALYKRLNVNPDIMKIGLSGQIKSQAIKLRARGWTYSLEVLAYFGLTGLAASAGWEPKFNSRFPLITVSSLQ